MQNVFESLPPAPLADLLLRGVCSICILRFFNVRDTVLSHCISNSSELFFQLRPVLVRVLGEERLNRIQEKAILEQISKECKPDGGFPSQKMPRICMVCLGILQLFLQDDAPPADDSDTRKSPVIAEVAKTVQQEGHKFDSFCLEISIPALTFLRERALWCYLNSRYSSEGLFKGADVNEHIVPLKESLKHLLIRPLEQLWNASFDANSTFRISLSYKHTNSSTELAFFDGSHGSCSKLGYQGKSKCNHVSKATIGATRENLEFGESLSFVQRSLSSIPLHKFQEHFPWPPPKLDVPCKMVAMCSCRALYVGGRYLKFSRNISQSPWMIDDERKGKSSVQEIIGEKVLLQFTADSYKFHAAGREDIDVRMLGNGRPFLLEITNARVIPTQLQLTQVEASLNIIKGEWVKVKGLRLVGSEVFDVMREGEAEKQKEYAAVVWLSRPVSDADFEKLSSLKELKIEQKTPVRVLHRRSPLTRPRIIHWMRCEKIPGSTQYFLLFLCSQAGTYIKEFVHGDLGRTYPNVRSLLDCEAEIWQLDVVGVNMEFV